MADLATARYGKFGRRAFTADEAFYAAVTAFDSPEHWYRFDEGSGVLLDQGSGTAMDASAAGANLTYSQGTLVANVGTDKSIDFDNTTNSYFNMNDQRPDMEVGPGQAGTFACVFRCDGFATLNKTLYSVNDNTAGPASYIRVSVVTSGKMQWVCQAGSSSNRNITTIDHPIIDTGETYFLVITQAGDTSAKKYYVNGYLVDSGDLTHANTGTGTTDDFFNYVLGATTTHSHIGSFHDSSGRKHPWDGLICEMIFSNQEWTAAQIKTVWQNMTGNGSTYDTILDNSGTPDVIFELGEDSGAFQNTGSDSLNVGELADVGTVTRASSIIVTQSDGAITLNGSSQMAASAASGGDSSMILKGSSGTIIFWVTTPSSFSTTMSAVSCYSTTAGAVNGLDFYVGSTGKPGYTIKQTASDILAVDSTSFTLSTSTTHMIAWVSDGSSNATLYVDSVPIATTQTTLTGTAAAGDWGADIQDNAAAWFNAIGGRRYGSGPTDDQLFTGTIDGVVVFDNVQLTGIEIWNIYKAGI